MHIYLKNNPAYFHPHLTGNARALEFFEEVTLNKKNNKNKVSSNGHVFYSIRCIPG